MGAYLYKTKPTAVATARVRTAEGVERVEVIALYCYAFKPSNWDEHFNARLRFKTGVTACETAYARSSKEVPEFGVFYDGDTNQLYPLDGPFPSKSTFQTKGLVTGLDDYDFTKEGVEILEWLKLPKGFSIKTQEQVLAW